MAASSVGTKSCMALVRCIEGDTHLTISFVFRNKLHKLYRPKDELVNKTITRLTLTLAKKTKRTKRKETTDLEGPSSPPTVTLQRSNLESVPTDTPNILAWQPGSLLIIDEFQFQVFLNHPQVKKLEIPDIVMVGCPIVPQVELEFSSNCKWTWFRPQKGDASTGAVNELEIASLDPTYAPPSLASSVYLHSKMIHWPTAEDLNIQLLLKVVPYSSIDNKYGNPVYCHASPVQDEPQMTAILNRQKMTPSHLSHQYLRVVSYNILADQHSVTDYSQNILYPYCNPIALTNAYRHGLLAKELLGYHSDIICLQEVAQKCFDLFLLPVLKENGYDGHYAMKTGQLTEGEAIFFNLSKYEIISSTCISLSNLLCEDPCCNDLLKGLQKAPMVLKNIKKRPTIVQVMILKVIGFNDKYLLVANTHLCFHPSEDHLRLFQAVICTRAIEKILTEFKDSLQKADSDHSPEVGILFCGDFNSCPCTGGYKFLANGSLLATHPDWVKYKYSLIPRCGCCKVPDSNKDYIVNDIQRMNSDEEAAMEDESHEINSFNYIVPSLVITDEFNGLDVKHNFNLQDACSPLAYTHYRDVFVAVLDYILFGSDHFIVDRVLPMPSHQEVIEHIALPSLCFPSDHLAICCELKWKL